MGKRTWSDDEIELLKETFGRYPKEEMELLFKRNYRTIAGKACVLGIRSSKVWSEEEEELLKKIYVFTSNTELEQIFNRSIIAIKTKAQRLDTYRHIPWNDEDLELFNKAYPYYSSKELAKIFDRSPGVIRAKASGLKLSKNAEALTLIRSNGSSTRYKFNEHYFSVIDNQDKACILGFILGDGCVRTSDGHYCLHVAINERDIEFLNYMKIKMESSAPIYRSRSDIVKLTLTSPILTNDLSKLNMVPRKARILTIPDIPSELNRHMLRGLFDADGSVCRTPPSTRISITGTWDTCNWFKNVLEHELDITGGKIDHKYGHCHCFLVYRRDYLKRFAKWLYHDANFFLSRKYNRFVEWGLL